ncbi:hypothetical protein BU23DRAFT_567332 [Bimuria novae-zelandiae CBS 107.79]|uniref:Uncharacterized protein n=1 Tax=Bimuria novae-zelandiae CBS 107.79 TaxID=1447943 RepID=A0A6A5VCF9_9PLEO|nr:hypothetical protein BU23DRAFT_567332 [Bimuria novae-zelandiae CBS 107.79]
MAIRKLRFEYWPWVPLHRPEADHHEVYADQTSLLPGQVFNSPCGFCGGIAGQNLFAGGRNESDRPWNKSPGARTFQFAALPFSQLQIFHIAVSRPPRESDWNNYEVVANLILRMPLLKDLRLHIQDEKGLDRAESLNLDPFIRAEPRNPGLEGVRFGGVAFNLAMSDGFLRHHWRTLTSLDLYNCDLKTVPDSQQLGFGGNRCYFPPCGDIEVNDYRVRSKLDAEAWNLLTVQRFEASVCEFEDMQSRLEDLRRDIHVSSLSWETDDDETYE